MSMCGGKNTCRIYRDKKFCKATEKVNLNGECKCRHAVLLCDVDTEPCIFNNLCRKDERPLYVMMRERGLEK